MPHAAHKMQQSFMNEFFVMKVIISLLATFNMAIMIFMILWQMLIVFLSNSFVRSKIKCIY